MITPAPLHARTATGLLLDLGEYRVEGVVDIVEPPTIPLYDQLIVYLDGRPPVPAWKPHDLRRLAGVATSLVCVRWSTWLARICDPALPPWEHAGDPAVSAIDDGEMARINIEASYALEQWIDLFRADRPRWETLAAKALHYLPLAGRRVAPAGVSPILVGIHPKMPAVAREWAAEHPDCARPVGDKATRMFANAALLIGYRNGPVEGVHGGRDEGLPLGSRRISPADEASIMEFSCAELAVPMALVETLVATGAVWGEAMMPYSLPLPVWSGAYGWSLMERSRRMALHSAPLSSDPQGGGRR